MTDLFDAGGATKCVNHIPAGCNVLFVDGRVEFIKCVNTDSGATPPVMPGVVNIMGASTKQINPTGFIPRPNLGKRFMRRRIYTRLSRAGISSFSLPMYVIDRFIQQKHNAYKSAAVIFSASRSISHS
jgi:prepilin-type processing-associated H-X9-DG protein